MNSEINRINLYEHIESFPQVFYSDTCVNYYLSSLRSNILQVINANAEDNALIIGDDFGVVSYFLSSLVDSVTIVSSNNETKLINQNKNNVKVVSNIPNTKYSLILCFDNLIKGLKTNLLNDGTLYLIVNNSLSIACFSGLSNSQTYKSGFSRKEIENYLSSEGFTSLYFYYPLPDYRFANRIYSQDYLPKLEDIKNITSGHLLDRDVLFDEELFFKKLIKSHNFEEFSNSFLVEAK